MDTGRTSVVIVDDDPSICSALTRLLVASGMNVNVFRSGGELLESGTPLDVDCYVLDIQLPDMTGFELFARLFGGRGMPTVIFITAYDQPSLQVQAEAAGASYFSKPFDCHELVATIRRGKCRTPVEQPPA